METSNSDADKVSEAFLEKSRTDIQNNGPRIGKRHGQLAFSFSLILVSYLMRVMMSISIVAMTDPGASSNPNIPTYTWSNKSVILSAFFWGYVIPQVYAGWLANKLGPKWILIASGILGSAVGLIIPTAAEYYGSVGVIVCRAIQGLCQGFVYPSTHYLLSQWTPLSERSRFGFFVYGGSQLGTVLSMFVSGLLASSRCGWPLIFYIFSGAGLLWCFFFGLYGYNSPDQHPSITAEERNFIYSSSGISKSVKNSTPWREILTSGPVWALTLTQCGFVWNFDLMLTQVPNYMNKVLNFDMKKNTFLSPLPYLVFWILCLVLSSLSDFAINKKILTIGGSRKVFSAIGFIVPSIAMIYLGNSTSSKPILTFMLLIIAVGGSAGGKSGFFVNQLDIAPNYAGVLMGIVNGISNVFGIFSTLACQYLVKDEADPTEWKSVFHLAAGICIVSCFIFTIFGSGEKQPWNDEEHLERKNNTDK